MLFSHVLRAVFSIMSLEAIPFLGCHFGNADLREMPYELSKCAGLFFWVFVLV